MIDEVKDIDYVTISPNEIEEKKNNIYIINVEDFMFIQHTKIYISHIHDEINVIKIYKQSASDALEAINCIRMVNDGIIILNKCLFGKGDRLRITLDKKLANELITIVNCKYVK